MHQKSIFTRAVSAVLLALTGCQDLPTVAPAAPGVEPSRTVSAGLHAGQVPFVCVLGRRTPFPASGWQTRIDTLFFPRAELHTAGQRVNYQFWRPGPDGRMISAAHCSVPYTEAAIRRVDRYFGMEGGAGADQFRAREGMITTQGCVTDESGCMLPPITVVAPVKPSTNPDDVCTRYPDECSTNGGGSGEYGGGGSGDAYGEGPIAFGVCVGALAGVMLGTASLKPYMDAVYSAAGAVDSERRMLSAVTQNGGSPEMIQVYQGRYDAAVSSYNSAVTSLAVAGGVAAGAIAVAVVACSPAMLLPA